MKLPRPEWMLRLACASSLALSSTASAQSASALRVARIFSDGVILQRGVPIQIWGWASPGAEVTVRLQNFTRRTVALRDSTWQLALPPRAVKDSGSIVVSGNHSTLTIHDVKFGDVWIASGQSNMEWKLSDADGGAAEAARAIDGLLRQFKIPNGWSWEPEKDLAGGAWSLGNTNAVGDFSAVAYFFAKELRREIGVPIGIINSAWSGAAIEPYMSRRAQQLTDSSWNAIIAAEVKYGRTVRDKLMLKLGDLPTSDAGMSNGAASWAAPDLDDAAWKTLPVPGAWERNGYAGLDGVVWLRTSFDLAADDLTRPVVLVLGKVDDDDITWVNGVEAGRTSGYFRDRRYVIPPAALRAGRNVLTVRVTDGTGDGGIMASAGEPFVEVGGGRRSLAGTWKMRVGIASFHEDAQHVNKIPTGAYNRMIHPLVKFPIKGVIWYQGESNANNDAQATAYRAQFASLIRSWRSEFNYGTSSFPFLWVQLPNYGAPSREPPASGGWALIREAQSAALALSNTAQVVTIDVGDATNLHPTNKQPVGERLALAARAIAYRQPIEYSGPTYRSHVVKDGKIIVTFNHDFGLRVTYGPEHRSEFALAGADRKFQWADAKVENNRVVVWAPGVPSPMYVRYAYSNSPQNATVFNALKLPASPFRTDK